MPVTAVTANPTSRFQEKREAILGAAAELFNEHGVKGATLTDIAARVGLVTNSVTYYYRKKEDLAKACFLRAIEVFSRIADEAGREPTLEARVHAYFRLHVELLAQMESGEHPPLVQFNDVLALPDTHAQAVYDAYTGMFRRVRQLLRSAETLRLSRADMNARAFYLLSLSHWVRVWAGRYEATDYARISRRAADIVLRGSVGEGTPWTGETDQERSWRLHDEGDDTREAFLRAASLLINEQGYRGASIDKISAQLNVTKGSFYHHHENKDDLVFACFERSFALVRRAMSLAETDCTTGWDRSCAMARALARFQLSPEGPLLRLAATSALAQPERRYEVERAVRRLTHRISSNVVDGMMDGSMRPMDPLIAAQISIVAINAVGELRRWAVEATADNVGELYVRPVFLGILCGPSGV